MNEPFQSGKAGHRYYLHAELVHLFEKIGGWQQPDHPESEEHALESKQARKNLEDEIFLDLIRLCRWIGCWPNLERADGDAIFLGNGEHSLNRLYRLHHDLEQIMDIMADYNEAPPEITQELATKIIHACGYKVKLFQWLTDTTA